MKILGRQFVFGRTIDEALQRAEPERDAGPDPQLRHARRGGRDLSTMPSATPRPMRDALDRIARKRERRFRASRRAFRSSCRRSTRATNVAHAEEAKAAMLPMLRELARQGQRGRHPLHHRRRGSRPARAVAGHDRGAARRRQPVRERLGRASGSRIQAYQKRAVPLCDWVVAARARAQAQADGPAGQGRLLGHRDQGRAGRRPARLSGVHAQGRDRRLLPRLRQEAARRRATSSIPPSPRTTPTPSARSRRWRARRRSSSSGCTAWARGSTTSSPSSRKAIGDAAHAGAHLRAGRQPQGIARLSRPPPARERRQFVVRQPHRRRAMCRSTSWSAIRSPTSRRSSRSAIRRSRCRDAIFGAGAPQQRRGRPDRSAGARAVARAAESA